MDGVARRHPRRLLLLDGDQALATSWVTSRLRADAAADALWVAEQGPQAIRAVRAGSVNAHLGREVGLLVFNAHQGFHPDAFAAALGTLRGGGDCVLMVPTLTDWPTFEDPDRARFATYPLALRDMRGLFVRRLLRIWRGDPAVVSLRVDDAAELRHAPPGSTDISLNEEQRKAVDAVERVAQGHARRPLVLTADRGRGKSTVLGVAASRLLQSGCSQITVIAPHRRAVQTLFAHAAGRPSAQHVEVSDIRIGGGELRFRLIHEMLDGTDETPGLLMVDEAAAIPLSALARLLSRGNRLVFASTVHGYEGSGRGFALRFEQLLDQQMPQWRAMNLQLPVRWSAQDPLEALLNRSLLLDAEPDRVLDAVSDDFSAAAGDAADLSYALVDAERLSKDEALLRSVFGLLITAHYQTRPSDLRQLLDNPLISVWIARLGESVVGVAMVLREGGLDQPMIEQVLAGKRRPRGHLLPQSLAVHAGMDDVLGLSVLRVQRIAVLPGQRRRGIGSGMLAHIAAWARAQSVDLLGCAHGADRSLLAFWEAAGFAPVQLGTRVDPASGSHSLFMLRGLTTATRVLCEAYALRFRRQLPWRLADSLQHLDAALAAALLAGRQCADLGLSDDDRLAIARIASAARQVEGSEYLQFRVLSILAAGRHVAPDVLAPLLARWLQHRSLTEVCRQYGLSGRGALDAALRAVLARNTKALGSSG